MYNSKRNLFNERKTIQLVRTSRMICKTGWIGKAKRAGGKKLYRILAFSDTHGDTSLCFDWLERIPGVDLILHAGDIIRDAEDLAAVYPQTEYVSGNNDYARFAPMEKMLFCEDKKLFLTHGHTFGVKYGLKTIATAARVKAAQICVFGHTHVPYCGYEDGVLLVNPGSASGRYASAATCAVIEIEQGKICADILTME